MPKAYVFNVFDEMRIGFEVGTISCLEQHKTSHNYKKCGIVFLKNPAYIFCRHTFKTLGHGKVGVCGKGIRSQTNSSLNMPVVEFSSPPFPKPKPRSLLSFKYPERF